MFDTLSMYETISLIIAFFVAIIRLVELIITIKKYLKEKEK